MDGYARIEAEEEAHRTQKALRELVPTATLPFVRGVVRVEVAAAVRHHPAAQLLTSMLVHLLLRMKGVVSSVQVIGLNAVARHPGVPLGGRTLLASLRDLASSLNGPESAYHSRIIDDARPPDLTVAIGHGDGDIRLGADAWRALLGDAAVESTWTDSSPLGPYMAAAFGAAEVFKRLLVLNFGWSGGVVVDNLAYSLLNHGIDSHARAGADVESVNAHGTAIAGAGAGGSAVLYTLGSFQRLTGELLIAEPGVFKKSNLNRYLLSTYAEVHAGTSKVLSAQQFLARVAPDLDVRAVPKEWDSIPHRGWQLVICAVDTPEGRWQVQRTKPVTILESGVMMGTLFAVLRVVPGGWCLECKHPPDPDTTWKKLAATWGLPIDEVKERYRERRIVVREDLERLADVQARPLSEFGMLEGIPFDRVPALTECGETPLLLEVPSQAPVLPFATTAAGVMIAAEYVKELTGIGEPLNNYVAIDLRHRPKSRMHSFRSARSGCRSASHGTS